MNPSACQAPALPTSASASVFTFPPSACTTHHFSLSTNAIWRPPGENGLFLNPTAGQDLLHLGDASASDFGVVAVMVAIVRNSS